MVEQQTIYLGFPKFVWALLTACASLRCQPKQSIIIRIKLYTKNFLHRLQTKSIGIDANNEDPPLTIYPHPLSVPFLPALVQKVHHQPGNNLLQSYLFM